MNRKCILEGRTKRVNRRSWELGKKKVMGRCDGNGVIRKGEGMQGGRRETILSDRRVEEAKKIGKRHVWEAADGGGSGGEGQEERRVTPPKKK